MAHVLNRIIELPSGVACAIKAVVPSPSPEAPMYHTWGVLNPDYPAFRPSEFPLELETRFEGRVFTCSSTRKGYGPSGSTPYATAASVTLFSARRGPCHISGAAAIRKAILAFQDIGAACKRSRPVHHLEEGPWPLSPAPVQCVVHCPRRHPSPSHPTRYRVGRI